MMVPTITEGAFVAEQTKDDNHLPKSDLDRILDHLNRKWITRRECPICMTAAWEIGQHATAQVTLAGVDGAMVIGGPVYPEVPVVCKNCGYTIRFNLVAMGLAKSSDAPDGPMVGSDEKKVRGHG
jgi:hypothetical protein